MYNPAGMNQHELNVLYFFLRDLENRAASVYSFTEFTILNNEANSLFVANIERWAGHKVHRVNDAGHLALDYIEVVKYLRECVDSLGVQVIS